MRTESTEADQVREAAGIVGDNAQGRRHAMSSEQTGPEVNEADLAEQRAGIDSNEEREPADGSAPPQVDEADWLEQQIDAPLEDDGPER